MTGIIDATVLTVCTIGGTMRFHVLANEAGPSETAIRDEVDRAKARLLEAVDR